MQRAIIKTGMTPKEIRAELVLRGITVREIAKLVGVTGSAVSQTICQNTRYKGRKIRPFIALALNKKVSDIWPDGDDTA